MCAQRLAVVSNRRILLEDFRVAVSIGIHDFERTAPQLVLVNVELELSSDWVDPQDRIENTLNYDLLRNGIISLIQNRHFNLQETLCHLIFEYCKRFAGLTRIKVSTRKPDIYPDCKSIGFELEARLS